ncbi:tripartite tricarboxylate transporter permease [Lipingzhangella sp. LS1_29]|uniref:Tripartite tricarboxylate transporter permease n=1 Tax=Lipingzhangella rawalii TaxID=2055835 RepID=A0ABU2H8P4_9ACTN|nr:tripartite tricarboxylate transporter permease [Lipingzhangella rawalii]MDS1271367.1 tripartite tricarboxylate transporter permease [Lipingzhangella rawalii]
MLDALLEAIALILTPAGILAVLAGAAIGLTFGILPGLGASQAMILLLPFTYGADPDYAILLFVAIMSAASFGGALPAILINTPGTPANVCTTFDGHPLAQRGEATRAIFISGVACVIGSIVGATALFALIPVISEIITAFGSRETFWLVVFGIAMISLASKGNTIKGLVAGGIGLLLAFVGRNYVFPGERFTGGIDFLYDGIPMIALLVGVFAVAPMVFIGARDYVVDPSVTAGVVAGSGGSYRAQAKQGTLDVLRRPVRTIRGGVIGVLLGIIPAVGGATASFINYLLAKQTSPDAQNFGSGSPEGLIASESANDAKDGGALMPTLAFGIPGDVNTAVLLGALLMHGVSVGSPLFNHELSLVMIIVLALVVGQIAVVLLGAAAGPLVTRVSTVHTAYLVPTVLTFALIGSYLYRGGVWDLVIVVAAAALAYGLALFNYPAISLVLGFLLGVEAERNFVQTRTMSGGELSGFFEGWIVWVLIGAMVVAFLGSAILGRRRATTAAATPGGDAHDTSGDGSVTPHDAGDNDRPAGASTSQSTSQVRESAPAAETVEQPRTWLGAGFAAFLLTASLAFLWAAQGHEEDMALFPTVVAAVTTVLVLIVLAIEVLPGVRRLAGRLDSAAPEAATGPAGDLTAAALGRHGRVLGWAAVFVTMVIAVGFLALPVLVAGYILGTQPRRWRSALILAALVAGPLITMGVTSPAMFWPGAIPPVVPDLVGGGVLPQFR